MAQSTVPSLRGSSDSGDSEIPPVELYKNAVEEYRFQVQFNWTRTQYLLVFNAAILAAAVALSARPGRAAALVYALGAIAAALSSVVTATQHGYYQAARNRLKRVEVMFHIPDAARVDTTGNQGARRVQIKVTFVVNLLLWSMVAGHIAGAVLVFTTAP
jgi:hypothetical protein